MATNWLDNFHMTTQLAPKNSVAADIRWSWFVSDNVSMKSFQAKGSRRWTHFVWIAHMKDLKIAYNMCLYVLDSLYI